MNIDDVIAEGAKNTSADPEQLSKFVDAFVAADDLSQESRAAFCAGYMTGMAHALGIFAENNDIGAIVGEITAKEAEWDLNGYI